MHQIRLKRYSKGMLLVAAFASTGCGTSQDASETLFFNGTIDETSAKSFVDALSSPAGNNVKWVQITSAGGNAPAGFAMGRLIRERHLSVRVRGYCISACAQYIFLAANRKYVEPGSLVLFHGTLGMIQRLHDAGGDVEGKTLFEPLARAETKFLDNIGLRSDLTSLAIAQLNPLCITVDDRKGADDPNRFGFASRFTAYSVSKRMIEQLAGGAVEGFWPTGEEQMRATLRNLPFNNRFAVRWADSEVPAQNGGEAVPVLPQCSNAVLQRSPQ